MIYFDITTISKLSSQVKNENHSRSDSDTFSYYHPKDGEAIYVALMRHGNKILTTHVIGESAIPRVKGSFHLFLNTFINPAFHKYFSLEFDLAHPPEPKPKPKPRGFGKATSKCLGGVK